jgi:hypothetical protein
MHSSLLRGLISGAAGTVAINVVTYGDMLARGRAPSRVPERAAERLASLAGSAILTGDGEREMHRRCAAGALLGYADGLCTGAAYGALKHTIPGLWWPVGATLLFAWTLLGAEGIATRLGATNLFEWTLTEWIEDAIPRAFFAAVTALAYEALG